MGLNLALTTKRNELTAVMNSNEIDVDAVKLKILELDQAFENFKKAHELYSKYLIDERSMDESCVFFNTECVKVIQLKERAAVWLSEHMCIIPPQADSDVMTEDSVSQLGSRLGPRASSRSKSPRCSSATSSARLKYIEEVAKRKALEAKLKVFGEQQALAEKTISAATTREVVKNQARLNTSSSQRTSLFQSRYP